MSRTARYKLRYLVLVLVLGAAGLAAWFASGRHLGVYVAVALLLLIPGRVQGHLYRGFFRGRRALARREYDEALVHFTRFLEDVRRDPGLKRWIWLGGVIYTADIEVMTLNNMGVLQLERGRLDEARRCLREALEHDPLFPLAHYNLAVLSVVRGDEAAAERHAERAVSLGYRRSAVDRAVHKGGELLARFEGRFGDRAEG